MGQRQILLEETVGFSDREVSTVSLRRCWCRVAKLSVHCHRIQPTGRSLSTGSPVGRAWCLTFSHHNVGYSQAYVSVRGWRWWPKRKR